MQLTNRKDRAATDWDGGRSLEYQACGRKAIIRHRNADVMLAADVQVWVHRDSRAGGINVKVLLEQMMLKVTELNESPGEYKAQDWALEPLPHRLTDEKGPAREMENEWLVKNEENQEK